MFGVLPTAQCFNPRPRVEGDPTLPQNPAVGIGFNPRPRVEGD